VEAPVAAKAAVMTEAEAVTAGLFDAVEPHAEVEADEFDADGDEYGDVPEPAYRPQQQVAQARPVPPQIDVDAAEFVAPRPRTAGTPTPEAMARLQAAVSKAPMNRPGMAAQAPRPAAPAPAQRPAQEKPRFGIGSLINRMSGNAEPQADRNPPARQQPPVTSYDDEPELSADQERIEIPAFLRRQAN
jgi:cell division protein FtsZ